MSIPTKELVLDIIQAIGGDREFWATQCTIEAERTLGKIIGDLVTAAMKAKLPCGHPVACASEPDEDGRVGCLWCQDLGAERDSWAIDEAWSPVVEKLAGLYAIYYAPDTPDSTRWVKIKEALEELMEAYDELLD